MDRDLAELRGAKTKVRKQAVRRNIDRLPDDFMFEPTDAAFDNWRSPFVIRYRDQMGLRYGPMAFAVQPINHSTRYEPLKGYKRWNRE